jgi:hypothetical protein
MTKNNNENIMSKKDNEIELKYLWLMIEYYGTRHYDKYNSEDVKYFKKFYDPQNPQKYKDTIEAIEAKKKWDLYGEIYWFGYETFKNHFGWSVPTQKAIEKIIKFIKNDSVLEMGSGLGLWAKLLQLNEIKIYPTDNYGDIEIRLKRGSSLFTDVENIDYMQALCKYKDCNILMIIWLNPFESLMCYDIPKMFKGNKIIYVGDYYPDMPIEEGNMLSCTPLDKMFRTEFKLIERIKLEPWIGANDALFLFEKK